LGAVGIDVLDDYHSISKGEDPAVALGRFRALATTHGITFLFVIHVNEKGRPGGTSLGSWMAGKQTWWRSLPFFIGCAKSIEKGSAGIIQTQSNILDRDHCWEYTVESKPVAKASVGLQPYIAVGEPTNATATGLLLEMRMGDKTGSGARPVHQAEAWLPRFLAGSTPSDDVRAAAEKRGWSIAGARASKDVEQAYRAADFSDSTFERARKVLHKQGIVAHFQHARQWWWALIGSGAPKPEAPKPAEPAPIKAEPALAPARRPSLLDLRNWEKVPDPDDWEKELSVAIWKKLKTPTKH
jgi:hypothetical protein